VLNVHCAGQPYNREILSFGIRLPQKNISVVVPGALCIVQVSWDDAPACKNPASSYTVVFGTGNDNRPWGFEEDTRTSCALRSGAVREKEGCSDRGEKKGGGRRGRTPGHPVLSGQELFVRRRGVQTEGRRRGGA
jgi:hypothetical protein